MMLARAELDRLAARGFVRLMLVVLLGAFGVTLATTALNSHRPGQGEVTAAVQRIDQAFYQAQQRYAECVWNRSRGESLDYPVNCDDLLPARDRLSDHLASVFVFAEQIRPLAYFLVAFLVLFGFLVGASSVGAELATGGMTNLLLWRPNRTAVLGVKLGTVLGATAALSVLASAGYLGAFWLVARTTGLVGTPTTGFWTDLAGLLGRGLGLVLIATALGFAIAALGRHTAAALGVAAGYAVVWEGGIRVVMEISEFRGSEYWMFSTYLVAWLRGKLVLIDSGPCVGCPRLHTVYATQALLVLLTVAVAGVAAAFATFRRRDLT
ncbi:ABC transporter permease [Plantactinospora siamensis]|uniref:ABC transporter permease n=1 Tax=Plantactinospora siamensis TaxID=555372 RepID=A0ABV6NTB6_9ACTN